MINLNGLQHIRPCEPKHENWQTRSHRYRYPENTDTRTAVTRRTMQNRPYQQQQHLTCGLENEEVVKWNRRGDKRACSKVKCVGEWRKGENGGRVRSEGERKVGEYATVETSPTSRHRHLIKSVRWEHEKTGGIQRTSKQRTHSRSRSRTTSVERGSVRSKTRKPVTSDGTRKDLVVVHLLALASAHVRRLGALVVDVLPEGLLERDRRRLGLLDGLVDFGLGFFVEFL